MTTQLTFADSDGNVVTLADLANRTFGSEAHPRCAFPPAVLDDIVLHYQDSIATILRGQGHTVEIDSDGDLRTIDGVNVLHSERHARSRPRYRRRVHVYIRADKGKWVGSEWVEPPARLAAWVWDKSITRKGRNVTPLEIAQAILKALPEHAAKAAQAKAAEERAEEERKREREAEAAQWRQRRALEQAAPKGICVATYSDGTCCISTHNDVPLDQGARILSIIKASLAGFGPTFGPPELTPSRCPNCYQDDYRWDGSAKRCRSCDYDASDPDSPGYAFVHGNGKAAVASEPRPQLAADAEPIDLDDDSVFDA